MIKQPYTKPALTTDEQIAQLRKRGMVIQNDQAASHYLNYLNYYRLTAYWLPFEADHATHQFQPNTTFEQVFDRYVFDRELRLLVMDAIERVEVAVRTQLAYQLSLQHNPHFMLDKNLFKSVDQYNRCYQQLIKDLSDSRETFITHLLGKYQEPLPPVWAAVEVMSLGQLSKWYSNLKSGVDRNKVANIFDFDEVNLTSFLHHLTTVRNICAHHGRLWNRGFTFTFKIPKHKPKKLVISLNKSEPKKIYNTLTTLLYLLDVVSPHHHWKSRLTDLLQRHNIPVDQMGFPQNWQQTTIWK